MKKSSIDTYVKECTTVIPEAIQEEFVRIPSDLAYWGEQHARAVRDHLTAKLAREAIWGRLGIELRNSATKMTLGDAEMHITANEDYNKARLAEVEAEASRVSIKATLDAVYAKKEMLISLGAQIRSEMEQNPLVRKPG